MTDKLPDELGLVRCAIYPQAFEKVISNDKPTWSVESPFDKRQLLKFIGKKKRRDLSVGSRDVLHTDELINEYGCRTAFASNQKKIETLNRQPEPVIEAAHYLGFYHTNVGAVRSIVNEVYFTDVVRHVENGELAHCHITMDERPDAEQQVNKADYRTQIIDDLWGKLNGPTRQSCAVDSNHQALLAAVNLEECTASD